MAIFKETKRPSKEMQATIAEQLGLKVSTVANFFMNARRRSLDKYTEDPHNNNNNPADEALLDQCELDMQQQESEVEPGLVSAGGMVVMPNLNSVTDLDTQQIVAVTPATIATNNILDHNHLPLHQHQQQHQHPNPPATSVNNV